MNCNQNYTFWYFLEKKSTTGAKKEEVVMLKLQNVHLKRHIFLPSFGCEFYEFRELSWTSHQTFSYNKSQRKASPEGGDCWRELTQDNMFFYYRIY